MIRPPRRRSRVMPHARFQDRHLEGHSPSRQALLSTVGAESVAALLAEVIPKGIRVKAPLEGLPTALSERQAGARLAALAAQNTPKTALIGCGYAGTITPAVIQRNVLEDPGWYTQYTPYQPEISQGRLEALVLYQTLVADLTGLPLANSSLLDEGTAAAEAMAMCHAIHRGKRPVFFAAESCHPQTLAVLQTRAAPLGIEVRIGDPLTLEPDAALCGALVQYPDTAGRIIDYAPLAEALHARKALLVVAADLLSLTLLKPPSAFGADIAVGSSQRFGVPMGFGGPHAAYMATTDDYKRQMPGRIVGVSKDAQGQPAYRLALQTREQHIRREKATSNICTAQVLLAIMAAMYAVYHGPEGLKGIAGRIHSLTRALAEALKAGGLRLADGPFFDTLKVYPPDPEAIHAAAEIEGLRLRRYPDAVGISLDELSDEATLRAILRAFGLPDALETVEAVEVEAAFRRQGAFLTHPRFHAHHSEHEMLRYLTRLRGKDISLTRSMIPLGSCTMKLNSAASMAPLSWAGFADIHPFAPEADSRGYRAMIDELSGWLAAITGFEAVSLQPNAGSQGELTGLLIIRAYHAARGEGARDVCLIPTSAHGTNPASAVMAGMRVVAVACDARGDVDLDDLRAKAQAHAARLAALMITYPSTHGVFEAGIIEICQIIHDHGGQVYLDGANMNAQVGLCRPADLGADVCHLNLHKTFAIPHGGGGPGVGPVAAAAHLAPFLPGHPLVAVGGAQAIGPVAAAPYGSALVLPITYAYIAMMGRRGLEAATAQAILNANYMAARLKAHYPLVYTGEGGRVAHEFILDCRAFKRVTVEDIAKRLMDFGFHAPTMSWPVAGTLMIEPTESESIVELDRYCEALIHIRGEIEQVESGALAVEDSPLRNAPHTAEALLSSAWSRPYTRQEAAYPLAWVRDDKYWPPVGRVDNAWGDRNLACLCPPVRDYTP
ncbi:aminomethyl-transferring glycine dehydrogenase [Myxococcota bacterium]|nr:aminomethyl-transferring glycine dehydrogenase [Myxococcota bacterium]